jgi:AraC-like DNA-binding protein
MNNNGITVNKSSLNYLLLLPFLFLLIIPIVNCRKLPIYHRTDTYVSWFTDQSDGLSDGAVTRLDTFSTESEEVQFGFTLKEGALYPYAGISFNGDSLWDLSAYTHLELIVHSNTMSHIQVQIERSEGSYSPLYGVELQLEPGRELYSIPLSSFTIPAWWYSEHNCTAAEIDSVSDFTAVSGISLGNSAYEKLDTPYEFSVSEISVRCNFNRFYGLGLLWGLLLIAIGVGKKLRTSSISQEITYRPVVLDKPETALWERITGYIARNYSDPELSINGCCSEVGITSKRLASLFRQNCGCTFKQYVNRIRLHEARRLLLEEDEQITAIFLAVGFNSSSHFNRLFVREYGESLSTLRKRGEK